MKKQTTVLAIFIIFVSFLGFSEETEQRLSVPAAKPARRRISSAYEQPALNPSEETIEKMNDPQEPFNGFWMKRSIGLEGGLPLGGSGTAPTILSQAAVAYGVWTSPTSGWEFYFGTSKTADSISTSETTDNPISPATAKTVTTTYSGTANPRSFILGFAYKHRLYQVKHFGVSTDFLATVVPPNSTQYVGGGTKTVSTADVNSPGNYTVTESNIYNYDTSVSTAFGFGPRFNVEYNFPYIPNLLIGVSTGLFVRFGGDQTTVRTTSNKSTTYTNGAAGNPTNSGSHGDTLTTVSDPGNSGGTYGIGGSGFNLTGAGGLIPLSVSGTFRIRYAF